MGVDTPSNASQLIAKMPGIVSPLLKPMLIITSLYAALTITITSTISSPKPVGHLIGFWGGTTGSTWMFLLLGFFSTDEHVICYCQVGLWVIYMFQILIGAIMVPEELRVVDDLHSISNIHSIVFLAVILAILGYVIDCSYVIATTQSGTGEDDIRFLAVVKGWIACILAFSHTNPSHASPVLPETSPEASTGVFPMQGLGAEGSRGNFQSWLFRMVNRQHQVQVQENEEMVHLLSDMDIV